MCTILVLFLLLAFARGQDTYLYHKDPEAKGIVTEFTGISGVFESSTAPRVVEFYSPYCPACKAFKPKYIKMASEMLKAYPEVEFYAVSCVDQKEKCRDFEIGVFPTIIFFPRNEPEGKKQKGAQKHSVQEIANLLKLPARNLKSLDGDEDEIDVNAPLQHPGIPGDEQDDADDETDGKTGTDEAEDDETDENQSPPLIPGEIDPIRAGEEDTADYEGPDLNAPLQHPGAGVADKDEGDSTDEDEKDEDKVERPLVDQVFDAKDAEFDEPPLSGDGEDDSPDDEAPTRDFEDGFSDADPRDNDSYFKKRAGALQAREVNDPGLSRFQNAFKERYNKAGKSKTFFRRYKVKEGVHDDELEDINDTSFKMRAHKPGTPEYKQMMQQLDNKYEKLKRKRKVKKSSDETRYKARYEHRAGRLPFQKVVPNRRPVEHIPIVKRFVKPNPEEELILDVTLSFIHGLRFSLFGARSALPMEQKRVFMDWLDLLAISLPSEWALHDLIDDLRVNIDRVSHDEKNLDAILSAHEPSRKAWSKSCKSGFTCGFWKLIHVMSIGVAEHRGGLNLAESGLLKRSAHFFSPASAAQTLRHYIKNFFPCEHCKQHFILHFDDCKNNRRCDRLTEEIEEASDADWKELPMWAWEVHNDVSVNILNLKAADQRRQASKYGPGSASLHSQVEALFPSIEQCIRCFNEDGSWNMKAIFLYLEKTYWPDAFSSDPRVERMLRLENEADSTHFLTILLLSIGAFIAFKFRESLKQPSISHTLRSAKVMATRATGVKKERTL